METLQAIVQRRSVRQFDEREVTRELIKEIIDVARFYPSWRNSQTARFHVLTDKDKKTQLSTEATFGKGNNERVIKSCDILLVLTIKKGLSGTDMNGQYMTSKNNNWEIFDSGIAAQTLSLVAFEKGVSSVILGVFKEEVVAEICNIPDDEQVSALIPLGYAIDDTKKEGVRKPVDEILFFV